MLLPPGTAPTVPIGVPIAVVSAITVAWVVSWMVIETAALDWRQPGRKACADDLLARVTLDVVIREPDQPSGPVGAPSTIEPGMAP